MPNFLGKEASCENNAILYHLHFRFYVLRLSDTLYPTTLPNVALDRFCYSLYRESYFISREKNQACFILQFPNSCSIRGSTLNRSPKSKRKRKLATSTAAREKALDDEPMAGHWHWMTSGLHGTADQSAGNLSIGTGRNWAARRSLVVLNSSLNSQ